MQIFSLVAFWIGIFKMTFYHKKLAHVRKNVVPLQAKFAYATD